MTRGEKRRSARLKRALKDKMLHFYRSVPVLQERAFEARKQAVSWRAFYVGAAALGIMPDGSLKIFVGKNHKPKPGPRVVTDLCAEMDIRKQAQQEQCVELVGFVIVAPHQPDDHSKIDLGATLCCGHCRDLAQTDFKDPKSAWKPDTIMIFVNADDPSKRPQLPMNKVLLMCEGV